MKSTTQSFFMSKIKWGHCIRMSTSLTHLYQFAQFFDKLQWRVVLNMSDNCTCIRCLVQSGATWWKTKTGFPLLKTNKNWPVSADRTARRQFQTVFPVITDISHGCRAMMRNVCYARAANGSRSLCVQISREPTYPLPIYWYHSKGNWLRYNFALTVFI